MDQNQTLPFKVSEATGFTEVPSPSLTFFLSSHPSLNSSRFLAFPYRSPVTCLHPQAPSDWLYQAAEENFPRVADTPFIFHLSSRSEATHCPFPPPTLRPSHQQTLQLLQCSVGGWLESSSNKITWGQILNQLPSDPPPSLTPSPEAGAPFRKAMGSAGQQLKVFVTCPEALA